MQKKYASLRLIARVINIMSWLMLLLTFLEAFFLIAVSKGINEFSRQAPELYFFMKALNAGLGLNAIFVLITGLIAFVLLNSVSEKIRIFIDLEYNTRIINNNLNKITKLLEQKFELQSEEVDEKESIIDKINYWGQLAPIVLSVLFFFYIIGMIPSGVNKGDKITRVTPKLTFEDLVWVVDEGNESHVFQAVDSLNWMETNINTGETFNFKLTSCNTDINEREQIIPDTSDVFWYELKDEIRSCSVKIQGDKCFFRVNTSPETEWQLLYTGHWRK